MILPIHLYGARVWDGPAKRVSTLDSDLVRLIRNMFETLQSAGGVGLAAPQVGLQLSVVVMDISGMKGYEDDKPLVAVNPEILEANGECVMRESCLSIPGIELDVTRAESIAVRFMDGNLREVVTWLAGMWARVFQHEYDHLHQKFITDHASTLKRQILKPSLSKIKRGEIIKRYPIISSSDERKMRDRRTSNFDMADKKAIT